MGNPKDGWVVEKGIKKDVEDANRRGKKQGLCCVYWKRTGSSYSYDELRR